VLQCMPQKQGKKIRTICDNRGNLVCKDHCNQQTQCQNCIAAETEGVRMHGGKAYIQCVPKRCIHKVNILYYNVYTSFWDTLYNQSKDTMQ
jgi:hypothetical protein